MTEDIINILIRTSVSYGVLILLMKIMGKREVGQLSLIDLIVLLTIANIVVVGIENYEQNILYSFIPMALLTLIEKIVAFISLKVPWFRSAFDGKESVIIKYGKLQIKEMKKQRYNVDDLLIHLRQKNIRSVDEVEYAILETTGRLSVFTYEENGNNAFPLPLIVSGEINRTNLQILGKGEEWLRKELKLMNVSEIKNIFCAVYQNGKIVIIPAEK